ncbi:MAG TPA: glycerol-3-phosphate dehydrogenase/oxidase [Vicinamibacterales bacterium]|nr:glycerol-3-phosphate dehydrogenase/oxidase [Vicinamibacterales bacterium]
MTRDLSKLTADRFDLLVVGGGIHGLFTAYDAAARGLHVALIDRGDIGSGLSFNHQRTIHGGLRALQSMNIGKVREQIRERRAWARTAPHLVRPLPFMMGTYGSGRRSRLAMRAAFRLYDYIGRKRNAGVLPELHLPKTRLESATATRRFFPGIEGKGLSGGAVWYDYQTVHPDRLTWTVALAAERAGAVLTNYVEALTPLRDGKHIAGVSVRDVMTGNEFDVRARSVILAAGSGLASLHSRFGITGAPPLVRAMNLLFDRPGRDIAMAAPAGPLSRGRMLTAVPWGGGTLVGTYQPDGIVREGEEVEPAPIVEAFLAEVRTTFPALDATREAVRFVHHGLVPGMTGPKGTDLLAEPKVLSHAELPGVTSLVGVKYTTARLAAERAVDAVARSIGATTRSCRTATQLLPHADVADSDGLLQETSRGLAVRLDRDIQAHLAGWYGTEGPAVLQCAQTEGALARLTADCPVLAGEVIYAVRMAAAVRLEDVVFRRTPLGSAGDPGGTAIDHAAAVMGRECGWSSERQAEEVARVRKRF